jgi:hypothetical protein
MVLTLLALSILYCGIARVKMKKKFKAVIQECRGGGACVTVPFDVEKEFGQKRVKIKATIDGEPYRGLLVEWAAWIMYWAC